MIVGNKTVENKKENITKPKTNNRGRKEKNGDIVVAPFEIKDCALITRTGNGLPAMNLREFRQGVSSCPIESIYHHFCETVLRPSFDDPEFHNDFARWARRGLHDHVLAERLEILDPYDFPNFEELRRTVLDIIDDHLSEISYIAWVDEGLSFHFLRATTVVFETGNSFSKPSELVRVISEMTTSSLYYHFWEARRRTEDQRDDFSHWLKNWQGRYDKVIEAIRNTDFYFMSLRELQKKLCTTIEEAMKSL
jgi:hypothetical protein